MTDQPPKPKTSPATKRVLVIDDDEAVRMMLEATLQLEGFKVKSARDGRNILSTAVSFAPDLIICDMMMPGGGGYEVFRSLQGDPGTRSIPIILVSGHGFDDSTKNMFKQEPNVVAFLAKPLRPQSLVSKIHEFLHTMSKEEVRIEEKKKTGDIEKSRFEDLF